MISGTLAGHTSLSKQKKYPKVRRRESLKDGSKKQHVDDCSTFGYSSLNNQDDDLWDENTKPIYSADHDNQRKNSLGFIDKNGTEVESPTGADYIQKLIHETKDLKLREAAKEKSRKLSCDTKSIKSTLENDEGLNEETNIRSLMKEKPKYLSVDAKEVRKRSKSDVDLSTSFLAGALKDSLFAAQFTVPKADGGELAASINSKRERKNSNPSKPKPKHDTFARRGSFDSKEKKPPRKFSLDKPHLKDKGKDHLMKGLQNTIFQPSLLAPKRQDLTNSCPSIVESVNKESNQSAPGVLRAALINSRFAIDIPTHGNKSARDNVTEKEKHNSEASPWQKVETIEKVNVDTHVASPPLPGVLNEAFMNTWLAFNITSRALSACNTGLIVRDDSAIDYEAYTDENANRQFMSKNIDREAKLATSNEGLLLNLQDDGLLKEKESDLPTFLINEPESGRYSPNVKQEEVFIQTSDSDVDDGFLKQETMEAFSIDNFLSSTSRDSVSQTSSSYSKGGMPSDDDRNKSIKDVLNILNSIQGEQEYGFFEDRCCAAGPGLTEGFVDEPATFHLVLMDKPDLGNLQVIIESPGILQPKTEYVPLTKNIIRVVYWPERVGRYNVRILWKKREIPGSPFRPLVLLPKCEVWIKRVL